MIRYALRCASGHGFEGWFASSAAYDEQAERGLVECPACGTVRVEKAVMSPAVAGTRRADPPAPPPARLRELVRRAAREVRRRVESDFEHVGDSFAREARAIHEGRSEARPIYGEATGAEVKALEADGVPVAPLPAAPPEEGELN